MSDGNRHTPRVGNNKVKKDTAKYRAKRLARRRMSEASKRRNRET